jgi:hypothetical protein
MTVPTSPPLRIPGRNRSNTSSSLVSSSPGPRAPHNTPTASALNDFPNLTRSTFSPFEGLQRIQEETPGTFFEAYTTVPENTEIYSPSDNGTPRTNLHATELNLPDIDEKLEQLPPPASSKFSTPTHSIAGDDHGEQLMGTRLS